MNNHIGVGKSPKFNILNQQWRILGNGQPSDPVISRRGWLSLYCKLLFFI